MKQRAVVLTMLFLALTISAAHGAEDLARLDAAMKAVVAFEAGQDSAPLRVVEQFAIESAGNPALRQAVEQRLIDALGAQSTRDAKDFVCRQLYAIGSARCVPALEPLLADPQLSHMARYALGGIADPSAPAALHRALGRTTGKLQIGVINSLGDRRYQPAISDLSALLLSKDQAIASAAAAALGSIGGEAAATALENARKESAAQPQRIDDALLACADRFLAEGQRDKAMRIYRTFYAANQPQRLRIAGLRGLALAGGDDALALLVEAIKADDADLRAAAIGFARTASGAQTTRALADLLPSLPPETQELVLVALGARADAAAMPAVAAATKSANARVRLAAWEALGSLGDASAVEPLLRAAASAIDAEQRAIRASLQRLRGAEVDRALAKALAGNDATLQIESARALAGRRAATALPDLMKLTRSDNADLRQASIEAAGELAGESDLAALVTLLTAPKDANDRPAIESAIKSAFRRTSEPAKRASPVLAALKSAAPEASAALLRLLVNAPTPEALAAVSAATKSDNAAVRDAGVRTLADWPSAGPIDQLLAIAQGDDATYRTLALRGYVRMAAQTPDPTAAYVRVMKLAQRPEDKKLVLGGLGAAGTPQALDLVEQQLADERVRDEAALAALQIADRIRSSDANRARSTVKKVLAVVQTPAVRQKAGDLFGEMDKFEGYIVTWLVAGPYQEQGKQGPALYDIAYPPEKADPAVKWAPLTKGVGAWDMNLEVQFGGLDHAVVYAKARVWSPKAQSARLEMGSDDALKVWVNGKVVSAKFTDRGMEPRQDIVEVQLREGWNDLLLKVVDCAGGWGFCCRVRGSDGLAVEGMKVEAK